MSADPTGTLTIAVCGNLRKHQQSYDSLRSFVSSHNAAVTAPTSAALYQDVSTGFESTASERDDAWLSPAAGCVFRLVNLNYDHAAQRMVLSASDEVKGAQAVTHEHALPDPGTDDEGEGGEAPKPAAGGDAALRPWDVDVLMHKVTSFGLETPERVLKTWCARVQRRRRAEGRPPMVVLDPFDSTGRLYTRRELYLRLDSYDPSEEFNFVVPPTFFWDCSENLSSGADHVEKETVVADIVPRQRSTPVGDGSAAWAAAQRRREARAAKGSGGAGAREEEEETEEGDSWWIAKPNEGTGPAFTHYLVLWKSRALPGGRVSIPRSVLTTLPREPKAFVVQQFYTRVFPMVLKVYYVAPHMHLKFSPTTKLLNFIDREAARVAQETGGGSGGGYDVPVLLDSQRKDLFTWGGAQPELSSCAPSSAAFASPLASQDFTPAGRGSSNSRQPSLAASTTIVSNATPRMLASNVFAEGAAAPETTEEQWARFFAPGTPARAAIQRMADQLSAPSTGLGLTLYGFDVLLMPRRFCTAHQRRAFPRGIGRDTEDGAGDAQSDETAAAAAAASADLFALQSPDCMFDRETGEPTALLRDAVPVIIDVNYFPSFSSMPRVHEHMLDLAYDSYTAQRAPQ